MLVGQKILGRRDCLPSELTGEGITSDASWRSCLESDHLNESILLGKIFCAQPAGKVRLRRGAIREMIAINCLRDCLSTHILTMLYVIEWLFSSLISPWPLTMEQREMLMEFFGRTISLWLMIWTDLGCRWAAVLPRCWRTSPSDPDLPFPSPLVSLPSSAARCLWLFLLHTHQLVPHTCGGREWGRRSTICASMEMAFLTHGIHKVKFLFVLFLDNVTYKNVT